MVGPLAYSVVPLSRCALTVASAGGAFPGSAAESRPSALSRSSDVATAEGLLEHCLRNQRKGTSNALHALSNFTRALTWPRSRRLLIAIEEAGGAAGSGPPAYVVRRLVPLGLPARPPAIPDAVRGRPHEVLGCLHGESVCCWAS